ncbi:hypothetical protein [Sphingomicrobium aestuariivivum]|uniref:hypothetical protein n=1 Tax=Sphingomicrobium aestuariivivum TaxID=1582356 RepID=UPI001FD63361|nr:hypothetical protein [Sphingomicrobium aestuariivivum]MCJ8191960.1 hypothetical protein [Sphingomicrobium aestuariivivum]
MTLMVALPFAGPRWSIWALLGTWFITLSHTGLFAHPPAAGLLRYAVYFVAFGTLILPVSGRPLQRGSVALVASTLGIGAVVVLHSFFYSYMPYLSIAKITSWTVVVSALWLAWGRLGAEEVRALRLQIFVVLSILLLFSLPLMMTGLGFATNGRGFQGLLNHPQAWGLVGAAIMALSSARLLRGDQKAILLCTIAFLSTAATFASGARTALVGIAVALAAGAGASTLHAVLAQRRIWRNRAAVAWVFLFMLVVAALLTPQVQHAIQSFLGKGDVRQLESFSQIYERSRGGLTGVMNNNISRHFYEGIGFGLASVPGTMVVSYDPLFGLPIGASVEKGNVYLGLTEEVGAPLALLVGAVVAFWAVRGLRCGLVGATIIFFVLAANFAEATFFSMGGMGLLFMALFTSYATGVEEAR